jgi:hypothetical protein
MAIKSTKSTARPGGTKSSKKTPAPSSKPARTLTSSVSSASSRPAAAASPETEDALNRLSSARANWQRVSGALALTTLFDALENVSTNLDGLSNELSDIRSRGYRFGRSWEKQVEDLQMQWPRQRSQAMRLLQEEQRTLQRTANDVQQLLARAARDAALISTAESRIRAVQSSISSAERRVRATFNATQQQAAQLKTEIARAQSLLYALDNASFSLLPDEHGVAMCRATWTSDQHQPEGILFLTDARLIFEQHEEVAKKKVLFITIQKELIQEKLWESPIGAVEELEAEDQKAFLRRKEMLTLRFSERTREIPSDITLQLKDADNDLWRNLIKQAKSGQIDSDRFGAPPPEETLAEEIQQETDGSAKELPTVCPNCNAPLPAVFKGMRQVTCDYCGAVINL